MDDGLRKIFKITDKEHIEDVRIPKATKERATVVVRIHEDYYFDGPMSEVVAAYERWTKTYNNLTIEKEYGSYMEHDGDKYHIIGERFETDDEYDKRQIYHAKIREENKKSRQKAQEQAQKDAALQEQKELAELARLQEKYGKVA